MKQCFFILFVVLIALPGQSQTKRRNFIQHEVGLFAGGSYYIGDLNPYSHFFLTQPAGGFFYRFSPNYRYAFRGGVNFGSVMGDDSQSEDNDQRERNLNFKSRINEFYAIAEFNFLEYRISNDKYRFSMFLFGGINAFTFKPTGNLGGNSWTELQPLKTEGQSKGYRLRQLAIPFGIGIKFNVAKHIGLGLEWGPRKTFTDYIDDVSKTYPDFTKTNPASESTLLFSNRSKSNADVRYTQRGNPRTKDWFFFTGLTVNFKINPKAAPCHAYGMD